MPEPLPSCRPPATRTWTVDLRSASPKRPGTGMGMLLTLPCPLGNGQIDFCYFAATEENHFQFASHIVSAKGVLHVFHLRNSVVSYFCDDISDDDAGFFSGGIGFDRENNQTRFRISAQFFAELGENGGGLQPYSDVALPDSSLFFQFFG